LLAVARWSSSSLKAPSGIAPDCHEYLAIKNPKPVKQVSRAPIFK
jgi:hypothetical protein